MKNRVIFYMVCTCISLSSCLDKNNLNLSDRDKEEELDLSFDFGMISEKKLEVTTRSNSGSGKYLTFHFMSIWKILIQKKETAERISFLFIRVKRQKAVL